MYLPQMKSEFLSNFFTIFPNELSLELFPIFTDLLITKNISEEFAIGTTIYNRVCKKSIELRKKLVVSFCFLTHYSALKFRWQFILLLSKTYFIQLREYQKDFEYRLHHYLSKFDRSVFLILKPISYFLAFIWLGFLPKN